jgi:hypothetical protein
MTFQRMSVIFTNCVDNIRLCLLAMSQLATKLFNYCAHLVNLLVIKPYGASRHDRFLKTSNHQHFQIRSHRGRVEASQGVYNLQPDRRVQAALLPAEVGRQDLFAGAGRRQTGQSQRARRQRQWNLRGHWINV